MLTSPNKRKSSRLEELLSWVGFSNRVECEAVFSEDRFSHEMQKEKSRIDRRSVACGFSVILMKGLPATFEKSQPDLLVEFRKRLRITDALGRCGDGLGVLLPETDRQGANVVAASLLDVARRFELELSIDILTYPDDDEISQNSIEYQDFQFSTVDADRREELQQDSTPPSTEIECRAISQSGKTTFFQSTLPTPLWKRAIDIVGSSFGLILLSPVFAGAAIAVKLSGPGPIFFRQKRDGKDGKPFEMIKFRTMCPDAEAKKKSLEEFSEQDGPAFKLQNDPRLTTIGKYLRMSCVDELPQLINILRGDMSLVGPRPLPVNESAECTLWQRKRLEVVPGLTCIWQLKGDRQTKFADWMRMDMEYIRDRSLWLDLKLIFQTVWVAVLHRGSV